MDPNQISETALTAAAARAAHLLVDREPFIFCDPLALPLLGERAEELVAYHRLHGDHPVLAGARAAVVCRSSFAAEQLRQARAAGVDQYVVLAAGLDSSAYRAGEHLQVFEVDHPAMQAWKRERLAAAGVAVPPATRHVPVDFELDDLDAELARHGFDASRPALVSWLGTTMYLSRPAIERTVAVVAGWAPGTILVLDYLLSPEFRDPAGQDYAERVGAFSAERGEPWLTVLSPAELEALLVKGGLTGVRQVSLRGSVDPACWRRTDSLMPLGLSQLVRAEAAGHR